MQRRRLSPHCGQNVPRRAHVWLRSELYGKPLKIRSTEESNARQEREFTLFDIKDIKETMGWGEKSRARV